MCVILNILPGSTVPTKKLFNAAANNHHSWGLIIKSGKGPLKVYKEVPPEGAHTDIDRIEKLLNDNIDSERFLHFRNTTKGETNLENAHPFQVFKNKKREVWFFHNGTFTTFGNGNGPESDTAEFCRLVLSPSLAKWDNGNYADEDWDRLILRPAWDKVGTQNRGLIVSNDLPYTTAGHWHKFNKEGTFAFGATEQEIGFYASNNDYFDSIQRGPVKLAMLEKERLAREAEAAAVATKTASTPTGPLEHKSISEFKVANFSSDPAIMSGLTKVFSGFDLMEPSGIADLAYIMRDEYETIIIDFVEQNKVDELGLFIEFLTASYHDLFKAYEKLEKVKSNIEDKKTKAERHIEKLREALERK